MVDIILYNGIYPPVSSNVAMRNPLYKVVLVEKWSINGGFSVANNETHPQLDLIRAQCVIAIVIPLFVVTSKYSCFGC